jgi:transposase
MGEYSDIFVGLDVAKDRHAVAIAEGGRDGDLRYFGEIGSDAASVRALVRKLAAPGRRLRFCYEAGPTGYGLKREIEALGHECVVIALDLSRICAAPSARLGHLAFESQGAFASQC